MEKIIELLNERIKEEGWIGELSLLDLKDKQNQIYFCSKHYGFIQRLVKHDKIDLLKLTINNLRYTDILVSHFSWEDRIIMILSIKDNPIEFLCSVLK